VSKVYLWCVKSLLDILKATRADKSLKLREVSALTGIDQAILSKIESGQRTPTSEQLSALSRAYGIELSVLRKYWLAEKIMLTVKNYPDIAAAALELAEPRVEYLSSSKVLERIKISPAIQKRLDVVDDLQSQWQQHRPLTGIHLQKIKEYYNVKYTYESNKIEGNTLSLQETQLVVEKGITISGKSLTEHMEAINHGHAVEMIYELASGQMTVDQHTLLELHGLILRGINQRYAGRYRDVPVMISGSEHVPPQPYQVDKMMEDYFLHYANHKNSLHPIILAAEMHERLASIHPFIDGNGRTARLVMNLILLQHGYTVAYLKGDYDSRMQYYAALEKVQVDNDPEPFYDLVIDAVEESLRSHLKWVVTQ